MLFLWNWSDKVVLLNIPIGTKQIGQPPLKVHFHVSQDMCLGYIPRESPIVSITLWCLQHFRSSEVWSSKLQSGSGSLWITLLIIFVRLWTASLVVLV